MNENINILIVEDEAAIREMVVMQLQREGYNVIDCESAEQAESVLASQSVHLMLLDWMLPGMDGVDFAKRLRDGNSPHKALPIILLTAKAEEDDRLLGFEAGADDYICKPFSLKEMLARIRSVLRRSFDSEVPPERVSLAGLTIDTEAHLVYSKDDKSIHLGPTEFKLLYFLMCNPGRVYSRDTLLDQIWGVGVYVDERTVDVHIRRLRRALEEHNLAKVIRTVRGSGYCFNHKSADE